VEALCKGEHVFVGFSTGLACICCGFVRFEMPAPMTEQHISDVKETKSRKRTKPRRAHPHHALTALTVSAKHPPGRIADGNGLYLYVKPSGAKSWVLRTMVQGTRRDIGLGSVRFVSLAEARSAAIKIVKAQRLRKVERGLGY
jgi:hypothetical protein|tara:strand:+ start:271 stop:699 length:429 start_codon:yes stop_codon:yes gene_type:complete